MKRFTLIVFILFLQSCTDFKVVENDSAESEITFEQKQKTLDKIGQVYYEKNCIPCHAKKGVKDNILESAIKSDKYDFTFLKAFVTNQDSLLTIGDNNALKIQEMYNQNYIHKHKLSDQELKAIVYYMKN